MGAQNQGGGLCASSVRVTSGRHTAPSSNTYSSGDLFSAGWADHGIGPLVCVGQATGAGGANVWGDLQLSEALTGTPYEFDPLPDGIHFTMAIRRAIRSGRSDGVPIEDLGIRGIPSEMTRRDLLDGNRDLYSFCAHALHDWSWS